MKPITTLSAITVLVTAGFLLGLATIGWFAYDGIRYPDYALYPVITAKPAPTDNGWTVETKRGKVIVPYEVYKTCNVGDRLGVVVKHDLLTHAEFLERPLVQEELLNLQDEQR